MKRMKANPVRRARQAGQQGAIAREQFKIDDRVDLASSSPDEESQTVHCEAEKSASPYGEYMCFGNGVQQAQAGGIGCENQKIGLGMTHLLHLSHGRIGQDGAAHLGQFDEQDPLRVLRCLLRKRSTNRTSSVARKHKGIPANNPPSAWSRYS